MLTDVSVRGVTEETTEEAEAEEEEEGGCRAKNKHSTQRCREKWETGISNHEGLTKHKKP